MEFTTKEHSTKGKQENELSQKENKLAEKAQKEFQDWSTPRLKWIDEYLAESFLRYRELVSERIAPLIEAMQYSLQGGGKRLRPLLLLASADYVGLDPKSVLPAACAIEFIHTYSMIHDDLPALDDDDLRRGRPTSHKKFGEAVAILAGDSLLTEAFGLLDQLKKTSCFSAEAILEAYRLLVQYSGLRGMVAGEFLDVTTQNSNSLPEIEFIHIHKTGALILCSALFPARLASWSEGQIQPLRKYGEALGLAFQISDDLLDSETIPTLRYARGPRKKPEPSYAEFMSRSEMKEKVNQLLDAAIYSVTKTDTKASKNTQPLVCIAEFIRYRK